MKRKKFVPFYISPQILAIIGLLVGSYLAYRFWDPTRDIRCIMAVLLVILVTVSSVHGFRKAYGYILVDDQSITIKLNASETKQIISKYGIHELYILDEAYKRIYSRRTIRINSSSGPIIGVGHFCIRLLVKDLGVPVKVKEPGVCLWPSVVFLLKTGQLNKNSAKLLKERFHIPQKLFDKWYDERQQ